MFVIELTVISYLLSRKLLNKIISLIHLLGALWKNVDLSPQLCAFQVRLIYTVAP